MDHYTDEQCAQLLQCQDQHADDLKNMSAMGGIIWILRLMHRFGDNPLIAHWLAYQYGLKCWERLPIPQDGASNTPDKYEWLFIESVPSTDAAYLDSIKLEIHEGYNAIAEAMLMRTLIDKHT